ncbi:MAG: hypothetical protein AAF414_24165 [Pseudomonadota bacterium]
MKASSQERQAIAEATRIYGSTAAQSLRQGSAGWLSVIAVWVERKRQRKALARLVEADDRHLLEDLGIRPSEAMREATKPFWR